VYRRVAVGGGAENSKAAKQQSGKSEGKQGADDGSRVSVSMTALMALKESLVDYQNPVPREVMEFQIGLAVKEASDLEFVPVPLRKFVGAQR